MQSIQDYRKQLYQNYSSHFTTQSGTDLYQDFNVFDDYYPDIKPENLSVLDLGCGKGIWMKWMHSKGCKQITGVDISSSELAFLKEFPFHLHEKHILDFLDETKETFDVIHCKDLIEHLTKSEVVHFLNSIRNRLRPGGELWLSTFNALAPMANHTHYSDFTHETSFTPENLYQILSACGFKDLQIKSFHPVPKTLRGYLRKFLYLPFVWVNSLLCVLRYGNTRNKDCFPTLFACARI